MPNEISAKPIASASFTITLGSLGVGAGVSSDLIDNSSNYPAAIVYVAIKTGTAPSDGGIYEVYLLRGNKAVAAPPTYTTDGVATSGAAYTAVNAVSLGQIRVSNSANTFFFGEFDTGWIGPLGPSWGIAVRNGTNQAANASSHVAEYVYIVSEIQ